MHSNLMIIIITLHGMIIKLENKVKEGIIFIINLNQHILINGMKHHFKKKCGIKNSLKGSKI